MLPLDEQKAKRSYGAVIQRIAFIAICAFLMFPPTSASAQTPVDTLELQPKVVNAQVLNVFVGDYIDPHNEALIKKTLNDATESGITLYIVQLDSRGVAGGDIEELSRLFKEAEIATAIWVGPTSAGYSQELNPLVSSSDIVGAASKSLAEKSSATIIAPSLREFIAQVDGTTIDRLGITLDTGCTREEVDNAEKGSQCEGIEVVENEKFTLNTAIKFEKLSPIANLGHALINPGFAIGILVLGLCLIAFEYFAASVGVASFAGISAAIAGFYGLGYLPTAWWAVALVVFGVFAMVVDVQAGGVGLYSIAGSISIFIGAVFATERGGSYEVPIIGAILIVVMALLFMLGAIPSLIRTRFGTPTIGREDFIGEEGVASGEIDPEGSVTLRGASWKARTNHATPIKDGEKCKVVKIEGIVLEVEPLVGAAQDYREKRSKK
jgi:membrane-bound serine protease (ClpP class)